MISNLFNPTIESKTDPYAANGLADHFREAYPKTFAIATRVVGKVPGLFSGGRSDWPAIVSAGFDPALLNRVPWQTRHEIAAEANTAVAYKQIETYAADPAAVAPSDGLNEAWSRINAWATMDERLLTPADKETIRAEQQAVVVAQEDALYEGLYGASGVVGGAEARQAAGRAGYAAAQGQYVRTR